MFTDNSAEVDVSTMPPLRFNIPVVLVAPTTVKGPLSVVVPAFSVKFSKAVRLDGNVAVAPITKLDVLPPTNVPLVTVKPPFKVRILLEMVKAVVANPLMVVMPFTVTSPPNVFAKAPESIKLL